MSQNRGVDYTRVLVTSFMEDLEAICPLLPEEGSGNRKNYLMGDGFFITKTCRLRMAVRGRGIPRGLPVL